MEMLRSNQIIQSQMTYWFDFVDNLTVNRGIDTDVLVAEVRATSHKPDEIYRVIERLSPGTCKVELFGRMHNCQPNWMTLGNQLGVKIIVDPEV